MGFQSGSASNSASQNSYGYNDSLAQSVNQSAQNVWGPQAGALSGMYGGATGLANTQANAIGGAANGLAGQYGGSLNAGIAGLKNLAGGGGPLSAFTNPNTGLAQQQLNDATTNIANQFQRVTMPGINSAAGQAQGIGGGRQGIATGLAMSDAQNQIAQAGTGIYSNAYNTAAQAASSLGDQMLQAGAALPGAAQAGYNLGMNPFSSAWSPYTQLASVLGGPTVLGSSYGLSQAASQAQNWGTAQSKGSQSSLGLKLWG
jgi:hypothetical protein